MAVKCTWKGPRKSVYLYNNGSVYLKDTSYPHINVSLIEGKVARMPVKLFSQLFVQIIENIKSMQEMFEECSGTLENSRMAEEKNGNRYEKTKSPMMPLDKLGGVWLDTYNCLSTVWQGGGNPHHHHHHHHCEKEDPITKGILKEVASYLKKVAVFIIKTDPGSEYFTGILDDYVLQFVTIPEIDHRTRYSKELSEKLMKLSKIVPDIRWRHTLEALSIPLMSWYPLAVTPDVFSIQCRKILWHFSEGINPVHLDASSPISPQVKALIAVAYDTAKKAVDSEQSFQKTPPSSRHGPSSVQRMENISDEEYIKVFSMFYGNYS